MKLKSIFMLSAGMLAFGNSFGQSLVSTGSYKYTLMEEGTGNWCGYCPDGAQVIQQVIEPTYPHAIAVAFHNADGMALTPDAFNTAYIGSPAGHGWPGGCIDRAPSSHVNTTGGPVETMIWTNRGYWQTEFGNRDVISPTFKVSMLCLWDSVSRQLTVTVGAKKLLAATGSYSVNAYVTEDSISTTLSGFEQHSYMYSGPTSSWFYNLCSAPCPSSTCASCAIIPTASYSHMGVVIKILGADMWGDAIIPATAAVGDSFSKTYTYTVPANLFSSTWAINWKKLKVVGLVTKNGTTTDGFGAYNDRAVQNSIRANVKGMYKVAPLAEGSVSKTIEDVTVYPNPAGNTINVSCSYNTLNPGATEISIISVTGQVMFQKNYDARGSLFKESISLGNISNGVYFMNISSNGETTSKQFVVSK